MKIEAKLTFNNIKNNVKRTIFTIISITLCTSLILTTMLFISSIRNGINNNIETQYNDYHFIIKNINIESFNKIKDKDYIDKIYIQQKENSQLEEIKKPYIINTRDNINIYIKYKNIKNLCDYSTDTIQTLNLSEDELQPIENKFEFNQKLLTMHGLIDVTINIENQVVARVNYSYVIDILLIFILLVFSILFIIILYNAFLITINERKKEYAILNSIGATEKQILKMIFLEGIIMGTIGIIIGYLISIISINSILKNLNDILADIGYNFSLVIDIKYLIFSVFIIAINIYLSAIIPSIKASSTSVIQGIRNNKEIKYKKKKFILKKIIPIEGKIAIKNIIRNKSKFRIITILFVVCMTAYITVSTYINYEKVSSELVKQYDVDAELKIDLTKIKDYETILNNYKTKYDHEMEYMEYKIIGPYVLVNPKESLATDASVTTYPNHEKSIQMTIVALDEKTYKNYINKLDANYGDIIIYNNIRNFSGEKELIYKYDLAFKKTYNPKFIIISTFNDYENNIFDYEIIDDKSLNNKCILTDELIEGYKEFKMMYSTPTAFVNIDKYNEILDKLENYIPKNNNSISKWIWNNTDLVSVKIKCSNIVEFSNYIENINEKQNIKIDADYYSLENQEKIIYINVIELILQVFIVAIIAIGIINTINTVNSSLNERKQEFKILYSLGANRGNINKIILYEFIYIFIKSTILSIILSIPILYKIIKYMENIIILNKLLIPFGNIVLFFIIILLILISIGLYSTKVMKFK